MKDKYEDVHPKELDATTQSDTPLKDAATNPFDSHGRGYTKATRPADVFSYERDWRTMSVTELAAGNESLKSYSDDLEYKYARLYAAAKAVDEATISESYQTDYRQRIALRAALSDRLHGTG